MMISNTLLVKSYGCVIITNHDKPEIMSMDCLGIPAYLSMIKKEYIRYIDKKIDEKDINSGEFPLLLVLNQHDKITQKELSDLTGNSEGLMTRVLKRLDNNGYVERQVDENNKRRKIITLTPKGKEIADEIKKYQDEWEEETFRFLTKEEFASFRETLQKTIMLLKDVE